MTSQSLLILTSISKLHPTGPKALCTEAQRSVSPSIAGQPCVHLEKDPCGDSVQAALTHLLETGQCSSALGLHLGSVPGLHAASCLHAAAAHHPVHATANSQAQHAIVLTISGGLLVHFMAQEK